jgi:hypothetical protein
MAKLKKELTQVEDTKALVTGINFEEEANVGFENVDQDSLTIPFLKLLQTNSPEVDESAAEYIKDARAGEFICSVTKERLGTAVTVIPCYYKRVFNRWQDRSTGGGFKGSFEVGHPDIEKAVMDDSGKLRLGKEEYFSDTRNHFILVLHHDRVIPTVLSLSSTQIKKSKAWLTQMKMMQMKNAAGETFTPPMYAYKYTVESVTERNDKGAWKGVKISSAGVLEDAAIHQSAKTFANFVRDNKVKVQEPTAEEF